MHGPFFPNGSYHGWQGPCRVYAYHVASVCGGLHAHVLVLHVHQRLLRCAGMLQSGCVTCVWELYTEQLAAYNKALEEVGSHSGSQAGLPGLAWLGRRWPVVGAWAP